VTRIERSALVAFSAQQMFDLVNDIAAYPQYMEGCVGSEVLERQDHEVVARLDLSKFGVKQSFVTRNRLTPPLQMTMELEEGPFDRLVGCWDFKVLDEQACKVSFELEFELSNKLLGRAAGKLLGSVANDLVDGLCRRADQVYAINR